MFIGVNRGIKLEHLANLQAMDFINMAMYAAVIFFFKRLIDQQDEANKSSKAQFAALIEEVKEVRNALARHQGDVAVGFQETKGMVDLMVERIENHEKILSDMNLLYDRVRINESDINVLKERVSR